MKYDKAQRVAQHRANHERKTFVAIQARNGQWMVESQEFVPSAAGRMLYSNRPQQTFSPVVPS